MGGDAEIEEGSLASLGMNGGELVEGDLTGRDPLYCAPAEMRWRSGRNDKFSPKSVPKGPTHRDGVWGHPRNRIEKRKTKSEIRQSPDSAASSRSPIRLYVGKSGGEPTHSIRRGRRERQCDTLLSAREMEIACL
jgi:hypothetical protein